MFKPSCDDIWDVLILGGGHNGLTAAAYLAQAGLKTLILEKNPVVGGTVLTEEFYPGFRNSVAAYTVSLLDPLIIKELALEQYGLKIIERTAANFMPLDRTRDLLWPYGKAARQRALASLSLHDADQYPAYEEAIQRVADALRPLLRSSPPNAGGGIFELVKGAYLSSSLLRLDLFEKQVLADLFTKSLRDFLGQWFDNEHVKALFAFDGIVGTFASPSTPGTAYVLLHHCFGGVNGNSGTWGHAIGGMGAITQAMEKSAIASGAAVWVNAEVIKVHLEEKKVVGVELRNGELVRAKAILSNVSPKLLFRDLLDQKALPHNLHRRFLNLKTGSGSFRMNVALSELPNFSSRPGIDPNLHHGAGIVIAPTLDYMECAYHDALRDGWSREPIIEMVIPSVIDSTLAPRGQHVASLFVQHVAPQLPKGRSWTNPQEKEIFADCVVATITRYAPNFKKSIIGRQILSPFDMEQRFGLIDGDIFHGQLCIDQLFSFRPVLGYANYRMPLNGLYICGSGAHPGGGVTGLPGRNAAREVLRDRKKGHFIGKMNNA